MLTFTGTILVLAVGWVALPGTLLRGLENMHKPPPEAPETFVGVVVLGGALTPFGRWHPPSTVTRKEASERLTIPADLMQRHAHLRLLYVGREEDAVTSSGSKMPAPRLVLTRLGVDQQRVDYEELSRNTYENAVLSAELVGAEKSRRWLLVTSARHMPRAFATFRAAGWDVTPYPVDYLPAVEASWMQYSWTKGQLHWHEVLHEYIGWLAYSATGRAHIWPTALTPAAKLLPPAS